MTQFQLPEPFVAWCHYCEQGFMSIDEMTIHNKENLNKHQMINGQQRENAKTQTQEPQKS